MFVNKLIDFGKEGYFNQNIILLLVCFNVLGKFEFSKAKFYVLGPLKQNWKVMGSSG